MVIPPSPQRALFRRGAGGPFPAAGTMSPSGLRESVGAQD